VAKRQLGDSAGEIADCTAVLELPGAPAEQQAKALANLALLKDVPGDERCRLLADALRYAVVAGSQEGIAAIGELERRFGCESATDPDP
jgi:hypothetical protein